MSALHRRILVIKLGALGDFVQALGPMAAIRRHHAGAQIVLLTMAAFAAFARRSAYFDEVWLDDRPQPLAVARWWALRRRLVAGHFDRVYDLQTSGRTGWYFRLMGPGPRPEWSGIVRGCSHPHRNPARVRMHTLDRQADQLRAAGIAEVPPPDLSWAKADLSRFALPPSYALLAPGGAAHRPAKRWPLERYADLARALVKQGLAPVVIGARADQPLGQAVASVAPEARDLTGATSLEDVASLARGAAVAIGNDTGPMHIVAAAGCPALVLFSAASDPALCAPRGERVVILRRERLADLPLAAVLEALPARPASARSA